MVLFMKKLVVLNSAEAVLISASLSHWQYHISKTLHNECEDKTLEKKYLDELDSIDLIKRRIEKTFFD